MSPHGPVRDQYLEFARHARGDSPCFEAWATALAADDHVLAWLADLPRLKQQPNLVFAAARWHGVPAPGPYAGLRDALLADDGSIRATVLARSTQTNEAGRLATLLPALALAAGDRPLALVEVGASAGLGQRPERWSYRWTRAGHDDVVVGAGPELRCRLDGPGAVPLPTAVPEVAWRVGLDLHPLDLADPATGADAAAWLETLIWPEHDDRRAVLRAALALAREQPPDLRRGDMLTDVPALVAEARASAGAEAAVFVVHSAVAAYLTDDDRDRFAATMTDLVADGACHWVSNEAPAVLPGVVPASGPPPRMDVAHGFVLGLDGRAVAHTHGHGRALRWLDPGPRASGKA